MKKIYVTFPGGKHKCFTASYDDGKREDKRLIDIFDANGIKCTFNINGGFLDGSMDHELHPRFHADEIKEIYKNHEIATHTYTHPTIERCPMTEVADEIIKDRMILEGITGKPVRGHAYPNGSYSEEIKTLFKSLGIAYGRVVRSSKNFDLPTDPLEWYPTAHHTDDDLFELEDAFIAHKKTQYLKLFYLWGHSYEFEDGNNWEVIEQFSERIGRRDDIWYATNIEIIDYLDAAKRLNFAADNSFVYNPSVIPVVLDVDGKFTEAVPGKVTLL